MRSTMRLSQLEARLDGLPRPERRPALRGRDVERATVALFADFPDLLAWSATRKGERPDPHLIERFLFQWHDGPPVGGRLWDLRRLRVPDGRPELWAAAMLASVNGLIASRWVPGRTWDDLTDLAGRELADDAAQLARFLVGQRTWPQIRTLPPCPDCGPACPAGFDAAARTFEAVGQAMEWRQSMALVGADAGDFDGEAAILAAFWTDGSRRKEYRELLAVLDPAALPAWDERVAEARRLWLAGRWYHIIDRVWLAGPPT